MDSLFIRETYLSNDKCKIINSRDEYVKELAKIGIFDISSEDYHMEHIIDKNGSPYSQNKNILGNLIMAKADWNRQVGQLTWEMVEKEKRNVYNEIFENALNSIIECSSQSIDESDNNLLEVPIYFILLFLSFLTSTTIGICIFYDLNKKPIDPEEDIGYSGKNIENIV